MLVMWVICLISEEKKLLLTADQSIIVHLHKTVNNDLKFENQ